MGFTEDPSKMRVEIDHGHRDTTGYSTLLVYLRGVEFDLEDSAMRAEIEREGIASHVGERNGWQIGYTTSYLHERYGFRVSATPYDPRFHNPSSEGFDRGSLRSYPFYNFIPVPRPGRLFPWTWEQTEVFPFSKIRGESRDDTIDIFGFGADWRFSGGATLPMAEEVLDAAPQRSIRPPWGRTIPQRDGMIITVDVVDLAVGMDVSVAKLEDHWEGNYFGSDELHDRDPRRLPIRHELRR